MRFQSFYFTKILPYRVVISRHLIGRLTQSLVSLPPLNPALLCMGWLKHCMCFPLSFSAIITGVPQCQITPYFSEVPSTAETTTKMKNETSTTLPTTSGTTLNY
jgi:hypothetical protein